MYEPNKGMSFYQAVRTLKEILAEEKAKDRKMVFNGIEIWVNVDSILDDIAYIYDLKCEIRRLINNDYIQNPSGRLEDSFIVKQLLKITNDYKEALNK